MHLEWWWVAVGNKTVCVAPATQVNSGYCGNFQGVLLHGSKRHGVSGTSKTLSSSSTSTLSIVAYRLNRLTGLLLLQVQCYIRYLPGMSQTAATRYRSFMKFLSNPYTAV